MRRKYKYIRVTIHDPFPLFWEGKPKGTDKHGPFYTAGAEFFHLYNARNLAWQQSCINAYRVLGYSCSLDIIER